MPNMITPKQKALTFGQITELYLLKEGELVGSNKTKSTILFEISLIIAFDLKYEEVSRNVYEITCNQCYWNWLMKIAKYPGSKIFSLTMKNAI